MEEEKLDLILEKMDRMESMFDMVEAKMDAVDSRFDMAEAKIDAVESRFDMLEAKMDGVESRFDMLEAQNSAIESKLDNLDSRLVRSLATLDGGFDKIEGFGRLERGIEDIRLTLENETNKNIVHIAERHLDLRRKFDETEMLAIRVNSLGNELRKLKEKLEQV